jgi:transcriptional regulator with XRE-family HTH domain
MKKMVEQSQTWTNFADYLKFLRANSRLSQGKVAKKLGYSSPQFVSNWERGLSEPPIETLPKIASIYQVSLESLSEFYVQHRVHEFEKEIRAKLSKAPKKIA